MIIIFFILRPHPLISFKFIWKPIFHNLKLSFPYTYLPTFTSRLGWENTNSLIPRWHDPWWNFSAVTHPLKDQITNFWAITNRWMCTNLAPCLSVNKKHTRSVSVRLKVGLYSNHLGLTGSIVRPSVIHGNCLLACWKFYREAESCLGTVSTRQKAVDNKTSLCYFTGSVQLVSFCHPKLYKSER